MILSCIPLMSNEKYFFMCLVTFVHFCLKCLFNYLSHFFLLGCFLNEFSEFFIFSGYNSCARYIHCQHFVLICGFHFYLPTGVCQKANIFGAPGWLSWLSVQLLVSAQVMISWFHEFEPHTGLCTASTEPAWDSLSLPFSLRLPHSLFVSLKINK